MASRTFSSTPSLPPAHTAWTTNVSFVERWITLTVGLGLAIAGVGRPGRGAARMMTTGAALALRGASGWCPVYARLPGNRRPSYRPPTKGATESQRALSGPRGVHVRDRIVIDADIDTVFEYWRDLSHLASVIEHIESVEELSERRSRWVARGPFGLRAEWDAEIINEVPGRLIAWQSLDGADIISAGSVRFRETVRGIEVTVHLQYAVAPGKAGAAAAWLLGDAPTQQMRAGLERFRHEIEDEARGSEEPLS
ncbi:MAG: SRPBCC family protein [Acidobacteriota bacterium]